MQTQTEARWTAAHWAMVAQTFIAGTSFSFARLASLEIDPLALAFIRLSGSAAIFAVLFFARGGFNGAPPAKTEWAKLLALAFVGISMGQFLFLLGLKFTTPASSAVLYAMTPLWVLMIATQISKSESLSKRKLVGVFVAMSGGAIVLWGGGKTAAYAENALLGNLITLGAAWCWAAYLSFGKKVLSRYDAIQGTALMMMLGAVMYFPIGAPSALSFEWSSVSPMAWLGAFWVTVLSSAVAYGLISYALSNLLPSQISVFMNAQPAIAASVSIVFFGEPFSLALVLGGAIAVAGIAMLQREK
ncbi:MAG: DMT family transporter [Chloroherpetonaceae bacterium]|nr:DMT family transporter [Chloroherpetonaceae bacterium]MDW8436510.1 DMT family transporter [Chloroherpetonaceae bacterium]